jgi:hypothetical protein
LGLSIRIRILDPDLREQEITHRKERKQKFMFAGCSLLEGPGFSFSSEVLWCGMKINVRHYLIGIFLTSEIFF